MGMTPHFERTDAAYAVGEREVMNEDRPCVCVKSRAYELMIDPSCPRHRVRAEDEGQEPVSTIEEAREQARAILEAAEGARR